VDSVDSLTDIQNTINVANSGASPSNVTASIISISSSDYRLLLTSDDSGAEGFTPLEADSSGILQSLGLNDGTKSINNATSDGAESDRFSSSTTVVGTLLDLTSAPSSASITVGDKSNISINLGTMSLEDIRDAINTAAPTGVTATVASETVSGSIVYYLDISGTVQFGDNNNVLEALGILKGGRSSVAEVQAGSVANTSGASAITAGTTWATIDNTAIGAGETITISGTDHSGGAISSTYTISDVNGTVQGLLTAIETAYSNNVTASITADGKIQLTDNTAGNSQLSLTLVANNEQGGGLDFGAISATTEGYDMELQSGQDAELTVNGTTITRSGNQIDDMISGVTLDLLKADSATTLTLNIERDLEALKLKVQDFLDMYNDIVDYVNTQNTYDEQNKSGGVLMGDGTLSSLQQSIKDMLFNKVTGLPSGTDSIFLVGISSDKYGKLTLDETDFYDALNTDFAGVTKIFSAYGNASDSDVEYVSHTRDTKAGTYEVSITAAASLAAVTGATDLSGGIGGGEDITITDTLTGRQATVTLTSGEAISTIVSNLNQEFEREYTQTLTGSVANTTDGSTPITAETTWANVFGANATDGDTIKIEGTNRLGQSVFSTYTIDSASTDKVSGLLSAIESLLGNNVTASIDSSGKVVVTDNSVGESQLSLSLIPHNEGGGSLDLGSLNETVTGRYAMEITASSSSGYLSLTHDNYGSANGFTISQTANYTGITDSSYSGVDVAGTINGESATGNGQLLKGDTGQNNVDGLTIKVTLTASELTSQGSSQGTLALTMGVAEQVDRSLDFITDGLSDGYIANRLDSLQGSITDMQTQIVEMNRRLDLKRENLIKRFVAVESTMSQLQNVSSWLSQQMTSILSG